MLIVSNGNFALAQEAAAYTIAGFDGDGVNHDWATNQFFQRMNERTGVTFDYQQYSDYNAWAQAKAEMLRSGNLPDMLFKAEMSQQEIAAFVQQGLLLDLAPLLAQHAPNAYRYIQENAAVRAGVVQPDGGIYTLPNLNDLPNNNVIWVNSRWLEAVKMEMPTDAASFRAVLEAFKTKDPNGNGRQDEVPMTFLGLWDLKFLGHAFGLIANDYNLFVDEQGKVQHLALAPQFRPFVEWLRDLYQDGLLDKRGFTTVDALRKVTEENAESTYGMLMGTTTMNLLPYADTADYQVMMPLVFEGKQIYRDLVGTVFPGAFALSADCPEPETLLAWIDTLYTEEGARLALAGEEGVDYEVDPADGVWEWMGDISVRGQQIIQEVTISESGHLPWRYPVEFQLRYGDRQSVAVMEQLSQLRKYTQMPYPLVFMDEENLNRANALQYELGLYLDTQVSRFIIGETALTDENWQSFLDTLAAKGLNEFLIIWQNAL
ncbi:MAG: extracellular solute-binding protein [Clostridia bacterium]|nr:extracellular solute-binding protein [Clostridia bacterium]